MAETNKPIPEEVQATRRYLEEIVAGKMICPPLVSIMKPFKDAETGIVDWDGLSKKVELVSFRNVPQEQLPVKIAESYVRYLARAYYHPDDNPATRVWILPDFRTNSEYDMVMARTKREITLLLLNKKQRGLVLDIFTEQAPRVETPQDIVDNIALAAAEGDERAIARITEVVLENLTAGAYIYRESLSENDLTTFPTGRGPVERYAYLNTGPYFLFQVINPAALDMFMGKNAIQRRRQNQARNTALAQSINLPSHKAYLRGLRGRQ